MKPSREQTSATRSSATIRTMFDGIALTYDLLNHLMSFGMDIRWRRKAVSFLAEKRGGTFLDIAAGSGDTALEIVRAIHPRRITAADFAINMLEVFRGKLNSNQQTRTIDFVSCDALRLPFRDRTFDGTIAAFGIRNFADRFLSLREMLRVLRPSGVSVILELTKPTMPIAAQCYHLYSQFAIPLLGKIISRHNSAYRYLPESIHEFPGTQEFLSLMDAAGFADTQAKHLSFGAATIFMGRKKE